MFLIRPPYRIPGWVEKMFPYLNFRVPVQNNSVFLTFDDGPTEGVTEYVLEQLDKYNFKATFFLIGDKIRPHADIVQMIKAEGHRLGNHTFHHVDAWKTPLKEYLAEIRETQEILDCIQPDIDPLFRPPYGHITPAYARKITEHGFRIIMWKHLSLDYMSGLNIHDSLKNLQKVKPGDIIVFHDSEKAFPQLKQMLPSFLDFLKSKALFSDIL